MIVRDHRNGDGILGAARAGVAAGERVATGHAPGLDTFNEEKTAKAGKEGALVSSDESPDAPDSPRGASGNMNAQAIFENTTYGRS
jgi:hypothetical protein